MYIFFQHIKKYLYFEINVYMECIIVFPKIILCIVYFFLLHMLKIITVILKICKNTTNTKEIKYIVYRI